FIEQLGRYSIGSPLSWIEGGITLCLPSPVRRSRSVADFFLPSTICDSPSNLVCRTPARVSARHIQWLAVFEARPYFISVAGRKWGASRHAYSLSRSASTTRDPAVRCSPMLPCGLKSFTV